MIWTIFSLLDGDRRILDVFVAARKFWQDFSQDKQEWSVEQFRAWFSIHQMLYMFAIPGDNGPAKKAIMVLTCLGVLCQEGGGDFGDKRDLAIKVAKALLTSTMSLEIREFGIEAVGLFGLYDDVKRASRLGEAVPLGPSRRNHCV